MKKIIILLCALLLVGCTSSKEVISINKEKHFVVQNQIECELIKNYYSHEINPSNQEAYYKSLQVSHQAHQFIDVILKITNLTSSPQSLSHLFSGKYEVNQQKYNLKLAMEAKDYNKIFTEGMLEENESRYVHLYCEVPETELNKEVILECKILGDDYRYIFTPKKKKDYNNKKTLGDIIDFEETRIALDAMGTTKQIEPSHKGVIYSYIPTSHDDEIFLFIKCDIKNKTSQSLDLKTYFNCAYIDDNQRIEADIIKESSDHRSVSKSSIIEALQTKTIYIVMPISYDDLKQKGSIRWIIEGKTFDLEL